MTGNIGLKSTGNTTQHCFLEYRVGNPLNESDSTGDTLR